MNSDRIVYICESVKFSDKLFHETVSNTVEEVYCHDYKRDIFIGENNVLQVTLTRCNYCECCLGKFPSYLNPLEDRVETRKVKYVE